MTYTSPQVGPEWFSEAFYFGLAGILTLLEAFYTIVDLLFFPIVADNLD
jgi:hypothetical protein